jgi:hypothetical protein
MEHKQTERSRSLNGLNTGWPAFSALLAIPDYSLLSPPREEYRKEESTRAGIVCYG